MLKSGKDRIGACRQAALRRSKALPASGGKSRCSDFLSLFSLLCQVIQRGGNIGKPLDEMPIMTHKANKRLNFGISVQRRTLSNGFQVLLGREDSFLAHMMGQLIDLCFEHITFGWLQFEAMLMKVVKNYMHPFQMFFFCLREDYYIIKVDEAIGEIQFAQAI